MAVVAGKLRSRWARMWGHWIQLKDGTTLWEDGGLDEKLEVIGLEKHSGLVDQFVLSP